MIFSKIGYQKFLPKTYLIPGNIRLFSVLSLYIKKLRHFKMANQHKKEKLFSHFLNAD